MAEPHLVSALKKAKRAELAGEIELTTHQLQALRAALEHLDGSPPCSSYNVSVLSDVMKYASLIDGLNCYLV